MRQRYFNRVLLSGAIFGLLTVVGNLVAQTDQHNHAGTFYTCGSDWARQVDNRKVNEATRLNNPQVYSKMVAHAAAEKQHAPAIAHSGSSGDEIPLEFFLVNRSTGQRVIINAVSKYISDKMYVWVDVRDTGRVRQATIDRLVVGMEQKVKAGPNTLDPNKGVIDNDIAIYGEPPVDPWEVKIHLLLLDIDNGDLTGGTLSGYFSPLDQTQELGSNEKNILYIDSPGLYGTNPSTASVDNVLGTIAHEFQHLINHGRYLGSGVDARTHWLYNEGLSEVASLRNGYQDRNANSFLSSPNRFAYFDAPFGAQNGDTILPAYERGMLFMHYLSEQFGDNLLNALVAAPGQHLDPVRWALQQTGNGNLDADDIYSNFWVANYLQNSDNSLGDARYRYRLAVGGRPASTTTKIIPAAPKTEEQSIKGYVAFLPRYPNATADIDKVGLKVRFLPNSRAYRVHAVIFRANDVIEVKPLTIDESYTIEHFSSITFVINSAAGDDQTVQWEVEKTTLGVEDYTTDRRSLALTGTLPNPVRNEARLNFHTSNAGAVRLQLFDVRGEMVRNVIDGARYESGDHTVQVNLSELSAGVYTARLEDATGAMSVRQIVVVK